MGEGLIIEEMHKDFHGKTLMGGPPDGSGRSEEKKNHREVRQGGGGGRSRGKHLTGGRSQRKTIIVGRHKDTESGEGGKSGCNLKGLVRYGQRACKKGFSDTRLKRHQALGGESYKRTAEGT